MSDQTINPSLTGETLAPISSGSRVELIDGIRGLAIFGILVMNLGYFAWPKVHNWPIYPLIYASGLDMVTDFTLRFLAKGKFYIIFTFLFGVGMAVQKERFSAHGQGSFTTFFMKRLVWMMVIGSCHGLLVWNGDILLIYALLGVPLLLFQNAKPRTLLLSAIILFLAQLLHEYAGWFMAEIKNLSDPQGAWLTIQDARAGNEYALKTFDTALQTYKYGTWMEVAKLRFDEFTGLLRGLPGWAADLFVSYLLGMWAWRKGLFNGGEEHRNLLRRIALWFGLVGVVTNLIAFSLLDLDLNGLPMAIAMLCWFIGKFFMGYAYLAVIALLWRKDWFHKPFGLLAPAGRMALSNYLTHSLVFTLIFNSYGLGLMAEFGEFQVFCMGATLFGLQVILSTYWMQVFRFGPVEWLWRSLTYMKRQPMKR